MKEILVPIDFSACANNAVKYAAQFAKKNNNEILFFHTVYSLIDDKKLKHSYSAEYARLKLKAENKIKQEVEKIYKNLSIKLNPRKVRFAVKFGTTPVDDILTIISENKIDLIIMGTHGASGLKKVLFGSNASQLISKANVPVLIVPQRYKYHPINEVIYATDLEFVKNELMLLKPLAKQLKTKLTSIHFDYGWAKDKKEIKNIELAEGSKTGYHAIKIPLETPLVEFLKNYMKKKTNTVLCMFHGNKNRLSKLLLGSNTEDLSMRLSTPLLSIRKEVTK